MVRCSLHYLWPLPLDLPAPNLFSLCCITVLVSRNIPKKNWNLKILALLQWLKIFSVEGSPCHLWMLSILSNHQRRSTFRIYIQLINNSDILTQNHPQQLWLVNVTKFSHLRWHTSLKSSAAKNSLSFWVEGLQTSSSLVNSEVSKISDHVINYLSFHVHCIRPQMQDRDFVIMVVLDWVGNENYEFLGDGYGARSIF